MLFEKAKEDESQHLAPETRMPIPTMFDLTLPVLELLGDGEIYHNSVLADQLAQRFNLTEAERNERTSSGQRRFANRISWARMELKNAVLLEYTRPGTSRITDRGRQVLVDKPHRIDRPFLSKFEEYRHTHSKDINGSDNDSPNGEDEDTPEENPKAAYETIRSYLANEIIEIVRNCSPSFFEQFVVDVLVGMGDLGKKQAKLLAALTMAALMGLSMRTAWVLMSSIYRPSDGKTLSQNQKFRSSLVPWQVRKPEKACSLPPPLSHPALRNMLKLSVPGSS